MAKNETETKKEVKIQTIDGIQYLMVPCYPFDKEKPRGPALKGNGVDVWGAIAKNGTLYLNASILGNCRVACFPVEPKE